MSEQEKVVMLVESCMLVLQNKLLQKRKDLGCTSSNEEEKENATVIETLIDKDFILWKNRRHIIEENKNLGKLHNYIKLSYPYLKKLKIYESTALTGSCNVVFQRLPPKKSNPGSLHYIGKLSKRSSVWSRYNN